MKPRHALVYQIELHIATQGAGSVAFMALEGFFLVVALTITAKA
jgi:hypothetical protein